MLDKGVGHRYIKPRTPRLNNKLQEWEDYFHRPHGGLGGQTPHERLRQKTKTQA